MIAGAVAGVAGYGIYQSSVTPPTPPVLPTTAVTTVTAPVTYTTVSPVGGKPIEIWWVSRLFFPEEQLAFLEIANAYTAETGTPVHVTFYDLQAAEAKLVAGVKTGVVPDMSNDTGTALGTRLASQGALLDVSDIVSDLQKAGDLVPVAPEISNVYDNTGRRSYYQIAQTLNPFVNTYWQDIFQKYTGLSEPPTDWDGWWGSFEKAQDKGALKDLGMNASAFCILSAGGDSEDAFTCTMSAYGGQPLTADGKVNYADPAFKKAVTDTVNFIVDLCKKGYIPAGATAWDDSSNNAAIESKKALMCYANSSLSIPNWFRTNQPDNYEDKVYWAAWPKTGAYGNDYKLSVVGGTVSFVMKDAKNADGAKDFIRYFMNPENYNKWFVGYQYRYLPVFKSSLASLPMYQDKSDHNVYPSQFYLANATADYRYMNPAWSQASYGEHLLSNMAAGVLTKNQSVAHAVDATFTRLAELARQYNM